jgi:hypothetical protein
LPLRHAATPFHFAMFFIFLMPVVFRCRFYFAFDAAIASRLIRCLAHCHFFGFATAAITPDRLIFADAADYFADSSFRAASSIFIDAFRRFLRCLSRFQMPFSADAICRLIFAFPPAPLLLDYFAALTRAATPSAADTPRTRQRLMPRAEACAERQRSAERFFFRDCCFRYFFFFRAIFTIFRAAAVPAPPYAAAAVFTPSDFRRRRAATRRVSSPRRNAHVRCTNSIDGKRQNTSSQAGRQR